LWLLVGVLVEMQEKTVLILAGVGVLAGLGLALLLLL
jgi:hypothetical protein